MLKNFFKLQDYQTVIIIILSLVATFVCLKYEITFDMPTGFIGIAIVFPIVFSINAAYRRREEALIYLASLKSAAIAIYYAHRDWATEDNQAHSKRIKSLIMELFQTIRQDLTTSHETDKDFQQVYHLFSSISISVDQLRESGVIPSAINR
jgi:hypothetical protein